jgi:transcription initiation factor TFIIIB Brf1 subunit/transcription initiation factor TFIIB
LDFQSKMEHKVQKWIKKALKAQCKVEKADHYIHEIASLSGNDMEEIKKILRVIQTLNHSGNREEAIQKRRMELKVS